MPNSTARSRIYRVEFDPAYQSLALADPTLLTTPLLHFDSTSKAVAWEPLEIVVIDPDKPEPDFWQIAGIPVGFVCKEKVLNEVQTLENISEALPVRLGDQTLYFVHVNERGCWDALDAPHCVWPSGTIGSGIPSRYMFLAHRLGFTTLMTVPETCEREVYVNAYCDDPADEFKAEVKRQKLTGLTFKKIWSEKPSAQAEVSDSKM